MADNIMAHSVRASLNHIEPLLEPSVPQWAELRDCVTRLPVGHTNNDLDQRWSSANQRLHGKHGVAARTGRMLQPNLEPGFWQEPSSEPFTFIRCISPTPEQRQHYRDEEVFMETWCPGYSARHDEYIEKEKAALRNCTTEPGSLEKQLDDMWAEKARWQAEAKKAANEKYYGMQYGLW